MPFTFHSPEPGVRIAEPSISVYEPGADHRAVGRHADDLAQLQRAEAVREHLGVGRRALVLHHHHRAEEAAQRPRSPSTESRGLRVLVLLLPEDLQQLLVDAAARVEALVDDQRLLRAAGPRGRFSNCRSDGSFICRMCR